MDRQLSAIDVERKSGDEPFHADGDTHGFRVVNFWQWACSDLANNSLRGILAEYLVAQAMGVANMHRVEWDAFDVAAVGGDDQPVKIEVKSAAYLQSWHQRDYSSISFSIRSATGWDAATNTYADARSRPADVYVFALLAHKDKSTLDPCNLNQWKFYVVPTSRLDDALPEQRSVTLGSLTKLASEPCNYEQLADTIRSAANID